MTKKIIKIFAIIFIISVVFLGIAVYKFAKEIPDANLIKNYRPDLATEVYDVSGKVIVQYFDKKNRIWVPMPDISNSLIDAVITAEDDTFFEHTGFNYKEIWNAFLENWKKGRFVRGGSTITQQLAKNVFLYKKKTIERKIKELFLTYRIEKLIPKKRILELYLNEVEWGDSLYGIETASRFYFDKHAYEINLSESAILASMLPNPKYFDPYKRLPRVIKRQQKILQLMLEGKKITKDEYEKALNYKLILREEKSDKRFNIENLKYKNNKETACYKHLIEEYLLERFGEDKLYRGGLKIKTGFDIEVNNTISKIIAENNSKIGNVFVALEGDILKSIICIGSDESGIDKIKKELESLGPPYNFYNYKIIDENNIPWDGLMLETPGRQVS